ncbi:transposase family protein [Streptomyces umbrinus]|uniref:transposase family protein n=1 Tax=Streptomyces umbrinus TaxID=67370 RepID=UPI0033F7EC5A
MIAELASHAASSSPFSHRVSATGPVDFLKPDPSSASAVASDVDPGGRRYRLYALLAAAAASVLAGARSLTAITEWICDVPAWACQVLGFPADPLSGTVSVPYPHTLRRLLVQLDGNTLTGRSAPSSLPAPPRPVPDCGRSLLTARLCAARAPASPGTSPCSQRWTTPAMSWPSARSPTRATRSPRLRLRLRLRRV